MTANNFRDLLDPWTPFVVDDGHSGLRVANPDDLLARLVPWVDCPTCDALGWVGGPTPKGADPCDTCPACAGTGHATVAQLLAWGQAVAQTDPDVPKMKYRLQDKAVADYRNRILGVQP